MGRFYVYALFRHDTGERSAALMGRKLTPEHRAKIAAAHRARGEKHERSI